jgi:hypothetical protein
MDPPWRTESASGGGIPGVTASTDAPVLTSREDLVEAEANLTFPFDEQVTLVLLLENTQRHVRDRIAYWSGSSISIDCGKYQMTGSVNVSLLAVDYAGRISNLWPQRDEFTVLIPTSSLTLVARN